MALAKRPFDIAAGAGATVYTGAGGLYGLTIREDTAVAAPTSVIVYDNTAAAGSIIARVRLAADGETNINWSRGVKFGTGLHITATGGDISGMVIIGSSGGLRALPFAGADLLILTGAASLDSVLVADLGGAVADWQMFDNTVAAGTPFVGGATAANETAYLTWPSGVTISNGLFFDQLAGATGGAAYVY
jgi:hypothetical protein